MCYYFSIGGKFQPVSNCTELHAITQAANSYALLPGHEATTIWDTTILSQVLTNHNLACWTKTAHATTWVISFFLVSGMPSGESSPPMTLNLDNARCSGVTPRRSTAFTSVPEYKRGTTYKLLKPGGMNQ